MRCCLFRPTDSTSPAPNISASRWPGSGAVAARHCLSVRLGPRKCLGCCAAIPKRWVTCRIIRSQPLPIWLGCCETGRQRNHAVSLPSAQVRLKMPVVDGGLQYELGNQIDLVRGDLKKHTERMTE